VTPRLRPERNRLVLDISEDGREEDQLESYLMRSLGTRLSKTTIQNYQNIMRFALSVGKKEGRDIRQ
jgi:hypothetical protein